MLNYKTLGKRIKYLRVNKNYTQTYMAKKLKLSVSYISNIERGVSIPSLQTIFDIANILEVTLSYLLFDNVIKLKIILDKEIETILKDLNNEEYKIMIELMKTNKEAIRKSAENERAKLTQKKQNKKINI